MILEILLKLLLAVLIALGISYAGQHWFGWGVPSSWDYFLLGFVVAGAFGLRFTDD